MRYVSPDRHGRAEQVEVFVADVLMQHEDGSFTRLTSFLPKNLLWSWTEKPFLDALSPGMYAFCTLGHIFDPARRRQFPGEALLDADEARLAGHAAFSVAVQFPSNKPFHILVPGTYQIVLWIAAGNARKVEKRLELVLTSAWWADEMFMLSEGVRIRVLTGAMPSGTRSRPALARNSEHGRQAGRARVLGATSGILAGRSAAPMAGPRRPSAHS
jgi:hypothetical protein